ncbi:response regulator [Bacillus sp. FJAT-50079]|uniref:response regulator n=1 Tax=Bacillus sp. FJAT-50079 TaxID=2833577 RepID=UPI001BC96653|nr:response regulator [Bacillus sp. FJAT-50079]
MKTVLLVDDDRNVIAGLRDHVPWEKLHTVVEETATDGEEALAKIKIKQPDIVITDIYMPNMNGLQLIEKLREQYPDIFIIIHSGYDDFNNARQAMKYGVQYFLLKPSVISEIEAVIRDVITDIDVQKKQKKLFKHYNEQMNNYLPQLRDSFFREILQAKYKPLTIPTEKLELLNIPQHAKMIVGSISLIRSPYLTREKEREWQLMKFGVSNIIKETVEENDYADVFDIHVVDYSETTFLLIFIANDSQHPLEQLCTHLSERIIDNILLILKLSLVIGIGEVKEGIHQLTDSYIKSQKALEVAEYEEINKVYTYKKVEGEEQLQTIQYPLDILKEITDMITQKEYEQLMEQWEKIEYSLLIEKKPTLFIAQNICVSLISSIMMQEHDSNQEGMLMYVTDIYRMTTSKQLVDWMREKLEAWCEKLKEELTGKKSHKLIREVIEYVQNYYDQEITLAEIADSLFVNRNYLSQLFKKVTGETFVTYLNTYRIEKAKEKLKEKNYLVYEISEMVGYQNPTYFSQVFKSITGRTPSEYYK